MNPRTTLVLAVVAALLGAFVWLYEIEGEPQRRAAADDEKRIHPGLESGDVQSIALTTRDDVEARFERQDGRWRLVEPVSAPADAVALDAIAGALVNLPREGQVEDPDELEQYGLGDGARVVRFEIEDGSNRGIRIGRTTPVGGHRYVARLADDDVAYVASYRLNALDRNLLDLRDRRIFGFEVGDVVELRLAWPGASVALEREDEGDWRMTSPIPAQADAGTIRDLLSDLSFLRARSFVDEPDDRVAAASEERALEIRWREREAGGETSEVHEAWIGGSVGEEGLLLSGPEDRLYTIAPERLEDFERSVTAYRDKTLAEFEVGRARRVRIDFADESGDSETIRASLEGSGWTSEDLTLDPDAMADLVRELARLRASDIVAEEMGEAELASLGLAPPRVSIRVEDAAESDSDPVELARIALGRLDPERGVFARRIGSPTVFVLAPELAEDLPLSWAAFQESHAVPPRTSDALSENPGGSGAGPEAGTDDEEGGGAPGGPRPDPMEGVELR